MFFLKKNERVGLKKCTDCTDFLKKNCTDCTDIFSKIVRISSENVRIFVRMGSKKFWPNDWTDWAEFFCGHSLVL